MRIEGTHKCNSKFGDCDYIYEWMAVVPQRMDAPIFDVETEDKPCGAIVEKTDKKYVVSIICPECKQYNVIEYKR